MLLFLSPDPSTSRQSIAQVDTEMSKYDQKSPFIQETGKKNSATITINFYTPQLPKSQIWLV